MVKTSTSNVPLPPNPTNNHDHSRQQPHQLQNINQVESMTNYKQKMIQKLRNTGQHKNSIPRCQLKIKFKNFIEQKQTHYSQNPSSSQFTCPICLEMLMIPCPTSCGHIFCFKCIDQSIIRNQKCPSCRNNIRNQEFIESKPFSQICHYFWMTSNEKDQYMEKMRKTQQWLNNRRINQKNVKVNDILDVKDTQHIWCKAKVVEIFTSDSKVQFLIHFEGWNQIYNQVINANSQRLAPPNFFSNRGDIPRYKLSAPADNMRSRIEYRDSRDRAQQRQAALNFNEILFEIQDRTMTVSRRNQINWIAGENRLPNYGLRFMHLRNQQQSESEEASGNQQRQNHSQEQSVLILSGSNSSSSSSSQEQQSQQDSSEEQSNEEQSNEDEDEDEQEQEQEQEQDEGQVEQQGQNRDEDQSRQHIQASRIGFQQYNNNPSQNNEQQEQDELQLPNLNLLQQQSNPNIFSNVNQQIQWESFDEEIQPNENEYQDENNEEQREYEQRRTWQPDQMNNNQVSIPRVVGSRRSAEQQQRDNGGNIDSGFSLFLSLNNENQNTDNHESPRKRRKLNNSQNAQTQKQLNQQTNNQSVQKKQQAFNSSDDSIQAQKQNKQLLPTQNSGTNQQQNIKKDTDRCLQMKASDNLMKQQDDINQISAVQSKNLNK